MSMSLKSAASNRYMDEEKGAAERSGVAEYIKESAKVPYVNSALKENEKAKGYARRVSLVFAELGIYARLFDREINEFRWKTYELLHATSSQFYTHTRLHTTRYILSTLVIVVSFFTASSFSHFFPFFSFFSFLSISVLYFFQHLYLHLSTRILIRWLAVRNFHRDARRYQILRSSKVEKYFKNVKKMSENWKKISHDFLKYRQSYSKKRKNSRENVTSP